MKPAVKETKTEPQLRTHQQLQADHKELLASCQAELEDGKLRIVSMTAQIDQANQTYTALCKSLTVKQDSMFNLLAQLEKMGQLGRSKLEEGFSADHALNLTVIERPCELLYDFAQCILSMLHFRVLSWN